MALTPGRLYADTTLQITTAFRDADGVLVDPTTVTFETISPCGGTASYVYGTDDEVTKSATGRYAAEIVPDEPGRWFYRWVTTGSGTAIVIEGDFLIQDSPFAQNSLWPDYSWW